MVQLPVSFITDNIVCHLVPIGEGITGCVYLSKKQRYHIFISDSLSPEATREVFCHEMHHILYDLPEIPYIIGIDMQREEIEEKANKFARIIMKTISTLI
jgi:Zn-dependent peptidase ImmA (M78 family)